LPKNFLPHPLERPEAAKSITPNF